MTTSKIIIFDFEVFRYDVLLGMIAIDGDKRKAKQTWDLDEMRGLYRKTAGTDWTWVGHNNSGYDDIVFEAIVRGEDPYAASKEAISGNRRKAKLAIRTFDCMKSTNRFFSLKLTELIRGESVHTSEVDFEIDRPLTKEERLLTESYNMDDLKATEINFEAFRNRYDLRLDLIEEFSLDPIFALKATDAQLAAKVLGAKKIENIEKMAIPLPKWPNLRLKNRDLLDFYHKEGFRKGESGEIEICGATLHIGSGGLHQAIPKCHYKKLLYCDVSGYYNLVMMNYDLLPRSVPEWGKERYKKMYRDQLAMKKTNPIKRAGYKTVLLAVFGAQGNEWSDFYDPQQASLVTIAGQLFLCDLLEKLDGLVEVVQTNTDGIMLNPLDWADEPKIISIIEEWEARTGFVIKKLHIYDLWQRDVNNYVYRAEDGSIECKGEALRNWSVDDAAYSQCMLFDSTNPPIVARGVVEYLMNGKSPEETVGSFKKDLRYFQYSCKKGTFDRLEWNGSPIQSPSRAFASKHAGEIRKIKGDRSAKAQNVPPKAFVQNLRITDTDTSKIDWGWYIMRIKERIDEFVAPVQLSLW